MKAAVLVLLISLVIYCPVFTWAETGVFVRGAMPVKLAGDFKFTEGPAVDKDGNIFFTDQPNDRIMKWSTDDKMTTFLQPPDARTDSIST